MPIPDPRPTKGHAVPLACTIVSAMAFCLGLAVAIVAVWLGGAPKNVALYAVNAGAHQVGWDLGAAARPKSFMPIVLVVSTVVTVLSAFAFAASVAWSAIRYQPRRRLARAWRSRPGVARALVRPAPVPPPHALPAAPERTTAVETSPLGSMTVGDPLDFAPPER